MRLRGFVDWLLCRSYPSGRSVIHVRSQLFGETQAITGISEPVALYQVGRSNKFANRRHTPPQRVLRDVMPAENCVWVISGAARATLKAGKWLFREGDTVLSLPGCLWIRLGDDPAWPDLIGVEDLAADGSDQKIN